MDTLPHPTAPFNKGKNVSTFSRPRSWKHIFIDQCRDIPTRSSYIQSSIHLPIQYRRAIVTASASGNRSTQSECHLV